MTKKRIYIIIIGLVLLGSIVAILVNSRPKTAGRYLDKIVELRNEKQILLNKISEKDKLIIEYREIMDGLQYKGLDYLGLTMEQEPPQRPGTESEVLTDQPIE